MKKRLYYRNSKFSFRHCIIFLVTVVVVSFGGTVSAENVPKTQWLGLVACAIEQQVSINPIYTPQMFANQKTVYSQDLEIGLRQDGIVVWRKINR